MAINKSRAIAVTSMFGANGVVEGKRPDVDFGVLAN
jgi:hypothetical protein